jgi:hypothetical protein
MRTSVYFLIIDGVQSEHPFLDGIRSEHPFLDGIQSEHQFLDGVQICIENAMFENENNDIPYF